MNNFLDVIQTLENKDKITPDSLDDIIRSIVMAYNDKSMEPFCDRYYHPISSDDRCLVCGRNRDDISVVEGYLIL